MEASKETILARMETINQKLMEGNSMISQSWSRETLLDAFILYFEQCSAEYLKDNKEVQNFIDSYRFTVSELKKLRINSSDFELIELIGNGNFGSVHLVKERQTGNMFAMKTIRKAETVNNKQTCYAAERDIMATTTSPWHVLLQYAFHDSTKLYMVMDYHPGGDLRGLLERQANVLNEKDAVFYLREIIVAICNLHDMGYIHRDIKPDNVLLDHEGHIKLADFGSAARIGSEGTVAHKDTIAAGTPDYIAPEVLLSCGNPNKGYGRSCDYWSLGIIAYEMIFGVTPFTGATTAETYNNIVAFNETLIFPEDVEVDKDYSTFVKQLLTDELIRPDYEKISCSPLFSDTWWDGVRLFAPPFVPALKHPGDTSLFTGIQMQPQPPNIENFMAKSNFSGRNLPFIGYTYTAPRPTEGPSPSTGAIREDGCLLEQKQRKIEYLRNRLIHFEALKEEQVKLEQKYEESKLVLKSAREIRATIEQDLVTAMTETSSLRTTLEAERNERKDLELTAIDLIRSAKERWKAEEDVRNAELQVLVDTQTQQITDLTTRNTELSLKLHKVTDTAACCAMELERLREVQEQYENKLKNSHDQSRKSFSGLQTQLKLVADDAESRVESLKKELEDAWNSNRKLQEQSEEIRHQNKLLESKLNLVSVDHERARAPEALVNENAGFKSRVARLETQVHKLQTMEAEATASKTLLQELEQKTETQQRELADYSKSAATARQLEISAKHEISRLRADIDTQRTAYAALQESSTILEQQVDGYDRLVVTLKNKEMSLETNITGLENDLAAVQEILQSTKQTLKIARNDRIGLDSTIRVLEVQMSDLEGEKQNLKEDLIRFERRYKELVDSSNETEKEKNQAVLKIQSQQSMIDTLKTKILQLKEESSERLTHLLQAREVNTVMNNELIQQRNEIDRLTDAICETEFDRDESQQRARDEILSLEVRLKQFDKVSHSLLDRLAIEEHKKKSIAKIFRRKNLNLRRPCTYYDLSKRFAALQAEHSELKLRHQLLEDTLDTPITMRVQIAMANASVLDARDTRAIAAARLAKAAVDVRNALGAEEEVKAYQEAQTLKAAADAREIQAVEVVSRAEGLTEYLHSTENMKVKVAKEAREAAAEAESSARNEATVASNPASTCQYREATVASNPASTCQYREATVASNPASTCQYREATVASNPASTCQYREATVASNPASTCQYREATVASNPASTCQYREATVASNPASTCQYREATVASNPASTCQYREATVASNPASTCQYREATVASNPASTCQYREATVASNPASTCQYREATVASNPASTCQYREATVASNPASTCQYREATVASNPASTCQYREATVAQEPTQTPEAWEPRANNLFRPRTRLPEPSTSRQYQPTQSLPSPTDEDYDTSRSESHCFQHFSCKAFRKCRWCWQPIKLLRGAAKCQNCQIIIHKTCQGVINQVCGVLEYIWDHYNSVTHDINPASASFDIQDIVCWVYQHRPEQRECRYLKFNQRTLYLYTEIPSENTLPGERYQLDSPDVHTNIVTDVSGRFRGTNLDKFVSIQIYDTKESGAPRATVMLEFLTDWDREFFIDAYNMQTAC